MREGGGRGKGGRGRGKRERGGERKRERERERGRGRERERERESTRPAAARSGARSATSFSTPPSARMLSRPALLHARFRTAPAAADPARAALSAPARRGRAWSFNFARGRRRGREPAAAWAPSPTGASRTLTSGSRPPASCTLRRPRRSRRRPRGGVAATLRTRWHRRMVCRGAGTWSGLRRTAPCWRAQRRSPPRPSWQWSAPAEPPGSLFRQAPRFCARQQQGRICQQTHPFPPMGA